MNKLFYKIFLLKPIMAIEEKVEEYETATIITEQKTEEKKDLLIEQKNIAIESGKEEKDAIILEIQYLAQKIQLLSQKLSHKKQTMINKLNVLIEEIIVHLNILNNLQREYLISTIENIISDLNDL
jgi:hypothetical protein